MKKLNNIVETVKATLSFSNSRSGMRNLWTQKIKRRKFKKKIHQYSKITLQGSLSLSKDLMFCALILGFICPFPLIGNLKANDGNTNNSEFTINLGRAFLEGQGEELPEAKGPSLDERLLLSLQAIGLDPIDYIADPYFQGSEVHRTPIDKETGKATGATEVFTYDQSNPDYQAPSGKYVLNRDIEVSWDDKYLYLSLKSINGKNLNYNYIQRIPIPGVQDIAINSKHLFVLQKNGDIRQVLLADSCLFNPNFQAEGVPILLPHVAHAPVEYVDTETGLIPEDMKLSHYDSRDFPNLELGEKALASQNMEVSDEITGVTCPLRSYDLILTTSSESAGKERKVEYSFDIKEIFSTLVQHGRVLKLYKRTLDEAKRAEGMEAAIELTETGTTSDEGLAKLGLGPSPFAVLAQNTHMAQAFGTLVPGMLQDDIREERRFQNPLLNFLTSYIDALGSFANDKSRQASYDHSEHLQLNIESASGQLSYVPGTPEYAEDAAIVASLEIISADQKQKLAEEFTEQAQNKWLKPLSLGRGMLEHLAKAAKSAKGLLSVLSTGIGAVSLLNTAQAGIQKLIGSAPFWEAFSAPIQIVWNTVLTYIPEVVKDLEFQVHAFNLIGKVPGPLVPYIYKALFVWALYFLVFKLLPSRFMFANPAMSRWLHGETLPITEKTGRVNMYTLLSIRGMSRVYKSFRESTIKFIDLWRKLPFVSEEVRSNAWAPRLDWFRAGHRPEEVNYAKNILADRITYLNEATAITNTNRSFATRLAWDVLKKELLRQKLVDATDELDPRDLKDLLNAENFENLRQRHLLIEDLVYQEILKKKYDLENTQERKKIENWAHFHSFRARNLAEAPTNPVMSAYHARLEKLKYQQPDVVEVSALKSKPRLIAIQVAWNLIKKELKKDPRFSEKEEISSSEFFEALGKEEYTHMRDRLLLLENHIYQEILENKYDVTREENVQKLIAWAETKNEATQNLAQNPTTPLNEDRAEELKALKKSEFYRALKAWGSGYSGMFHKYKNATMPDFVAELEGKQFEMDMITMPPFLIAAFADKSQPETLFASDSGKDVLGLHGARGLMESVMNAGNWLAHALTSMEVWAAKLRAKIPNEALHPEAVEATSKIEEILQQENPSESARNIYATIANYYKFWKPQNLMYAASLLGQKIKVADLKTLKTGFLFVMGLTFLGYALDYNSNVEEMTELHGSYGVKDMLAHSWSRATLITTAFYTTFRNLWWTNNVGVVEADGKATERKQQLISTSLKILQKTVGTLMSKSGKEERMQSIKEDLIKIQSYYEMNWSLKTPSEITEAIAALENGQFDSSLIQKAVGAAIKNAPFSVKASNTWIKGSNFVLACVTTIIAMALASKLWGFVMQFSSEVAVAMGLVTFPALIAYGTILKSTGDKGRVRFAYRNSVKRLKRSLETLEKNSGKEVSNKERRNYLNAIQEVIDVYSKFKVEGETLAESSIEPTQELDSLPDGIEKFHLARTRNEMIEMSKKILGHLVQKAPQKVHERSVKWAEKKCDIWFGDAAPAT